MSEPVEEEVSLPTIYEYCIQVYQAMKQEASQESLGPQYGEEEGLVWDGFSTKLISGLNLPVPYYTKVFSELKRMDCVRQLRRGGSTTTSRWLLLQDPSRELFMKMPEQRKPGANRLDRVEQQIRDLNERLMMLEQLQ